MDFLIKLRAAEARNNSLLCVGLDPDVAKLPSSIASQPDPLFTFNKAIIDATADLVSVYKPNTAFYEGLGADGVKQLKQTCEYIQQNYSGIPILLDFKRGDIGNTNNYYAEYAFEYLGVDAITVHPYFGQEASEAFLAYKEKGIVILCRSSNPGAGEFQDLEVDGKKLYRIVAEAVMNKWNENKNCLLMIGSPYPEELAEVRQALGDDVTFLIPGIGAQGGDVEATVKAGVNSKGTGVMISASRSVIFAGNGEDFAEAARAEAIKLRDEINKYR